MKQWHRWRWVLLAATAVGACVLVFAATWPASCWDLHFNLATDACTNRFGIRLPAIGHPFDIFAMRDALEWRSLVATSAAATAGLFAGVVLMAARRR